jgi:hypothetical protein
LAQAAFELEALAQDLQPGRRANVTVLPVSPDAFDGGSGTGESATTSVTVAVFPAPFVFAATYVKLSVPVNSPAGV